MKRLALIMTTLLALSACEVPTGTVEEPPVDLGDFKLGHNIVVAPQLQKGPLSRDASDEKWIASMKQAIDARFGRYDGTRLVHFGVNLSGYVLAQPGVPLIYSPKSALIITVTAWDDRAGTRFNEEAKEIVVIETLTGASIVGSGLSQDADEQMANLTYNAARAIEKWMYENRACLVDDVPADVLATCWLDSDEERAARRKALEELR